jgi:glyoxylase-like metal-dependent hydrolase (beta-lactamase superfamily II)
MGDIKWNAAVWIPSFKTLYGSDILFNQVHPFTCEVTPTQRLGWIESIDRLSGMGAEVVIPGHKKPGVPLDDSTFKFIKDYLLATDEEIANTTDAASFFYNMARRFPRAVLVWFSDEMNAEVFKGGRAWDWSEE